MDLQGKKVLELGAGTGLVAIVASLLGELSIDSLCCLTLTNTACNIASEPAVP